MAKRDATAQRKAAMLKELRTAYRESYRSPSKAALSQRELAARFGLSARTISLVLRQLVAEGVLYTVPRVGTFMGQPEYRETELYLMIRPNALPGGFRAQMQSGFETRLGQLGCASLALTPEEMHLHHAQGDLPEPAGLFCIGTDIGDTVLPEACANNVSFGPAPRTLDACSTVDFDNVYGGHQATRHLLQLGHRKIAFLALHGENDAGGRDGGRFAWSAQREAGWQRAMHEAGLDTAGLAFHPAETAEWNSDKQAATAQPVAADLIADSEVSAIIAVNGFAARGVLLALRESGLAARDWPSILCFDMPESTDSVVSCLQLPWDKIGAEAAQLLWERKNGELTGPAATRLVPMTLVPRLTCRADWAASTLAHGRSMTVSMNAGRNATTAFGILEPSGY